MIPFLYILADAAEASSGTVLQMPILWLVGIGTGLVGALTFIYRQHTAAQEKLFALAMKQNETTMAHHDAFVKKAEDERKQADAERKEATADRAKYTAELQHLVQNIAQERLLLGEQMLKTVAENTQALTMNTRARETAALEMEKVVKEVAGAVIMKLNELGFLVTPAKLPATKARKLPPKKHAVRKRAMAGRGPE